MDELDQSSSAQKSKLNSIGYFVANQKNEVNDTVLNLVGTDLNTRSERTISIARSLNQDQNGPDSLSGFLIWQAEIDEYHWWATPHS